MSRKRKEDVVSDFPEQTSEPEVSSLEQPARALVQYIRAQEKSTGTVTTAHGPLLVLDPEVLNTYMSAIESVLEPEPEVEVVDEPVPVSASADLSGEGGVNRIDE